MGSHPTTGVASLSMNRDELSSVVRADSGRVDGTTEPDAVACAVRAIKPSGAGGALVPLQTTVEDVLITTGGVRPFRKNGPRIEAQEILGKRLVHNYGHGGSGWSLSWGSADLARDIALANGAKEIAVVGAGAIGLTTALQLLRAGAKVTVYYKDDFETTTSAAGTGLWTPDSRFCLTSEANDALRTTWAAMARRSHAAHAEVRRAEPELVREIVVYSVDACTLPPGGGSAYAPLLADLAPDLAPQVRVEADGGRLFPGTRSVSSTRSTIFNLFSYARWLRAQITLAGGRFVRRAFSTANDVAALGQPVIVNCTGLASRELFGDEQLVGIPGQTTHTRTQPGVDYGILHRETLFLPRGDGFVFLRFGANLDVPGASLHVDPRLAASAISTITSLFRR